MAGSEQRCNERKTGPPLCASICSGDILKAERIRPPSPYRIDGKAFSIDLYLDSYGIHLNVNMPRTSSDNVRDSQHPGILVFRFHRNSRTGRSLCSFGIL